MMTERDKQQDQSSAGAMHPLFDDASFYRVATRDSLWNDGGRQSVVDFFNALARESLHSEWMYEVPKEVQDWGFPRPIDDSIHEFLKRNYERAQENVQHSRRVVRSADESTRRMQDRAAKLPAPALIVAVLYGGRAKQRFELKREPDFVVTGVGERPEAAPDKFWVKIPGLPAGHRCLLLILARDIVNRLAQVLQRAEPANEAAAIEIVAASLDARALSAVRQQDRDLHRAFRLSGILALAPGLEGATDSEGQFQECVDLGKPCPVLGPWTWVVACVGPKLGHDATAN